MTRNFDKVNDWDVVLTDEVLTPVYNNEKKGYHITMDKVIDSINKSKYPLNGGNVWLPDENGNLITLPEYINQYGGIGPGGGGANGRNNYRLEINSTNGNIIKDKNFQTTIKATLYENNIDVTNEKDEKYFKWARVSGATEYDQIADAQWNLKWSAGAKEIPLTADDVNRNAMFQVQFVTEAEAQLWVNEAYKEYIQKITNK